MPTFEYQAEQEDGTVVSGRMFGASLDAAASSLVNRGLKVRQMGVAVNVGDPLGVPPPSPVAPPVEVPAAEREPESIVQPTITGPDTHQRSYLQTSVWGPLVDRVPLEALGFFFRQSATMLEAGVPIVQTMNTLAKQCTDGKLQMILREMGEHVEAGRPISFGMQRYPEAFSPVMVSLTRAGEKGGFVDEALSQVADYVDREVALRNLYKRITFMPKLQIGASIVIILVTNAILAGLAPGARGLSSPLTTPATWLFLAPIIIFLFFFFRVGLANGGIKYFWDYAINRMPGMGKIMQEFCMAKFGRAFGALYKAGIPLTECMQLAADACGNEYIRSRMYPAVKVLESGEGMAETLRQTGAFSPLVIDLITTGETTGNVDKMLAKMAEYYEDDAATKATQLATTTGVVLFLLVAIYIGIIIISFYSGYAGGMMGSGG